MIGDVLGPLKTFGRRFKRPRNYHRNDETKRDENDKGLHDPRRRFKGRQQDRRGLNKQPGHDRIRDRDFVNVAPFEFAEEVERVHLNFVMGQSARCSREVAGIRDRFESSPRPDRFSVAELKRCNRRESKVTAAMSSLLQRARPRGPEVEPDY
jgi:hypothetical protein